MEHLKVAIGSDHGGYRYKESVIDYLKSRNIEFIDVGTHTPESCDYPDIARKVAEKVISGEVNRGILICGTGIGMSIAANRHKGIRAALCTIPEYARLAREHNNANVLCLGARFVGFDEAVKITDVFLNTEFLGGRHQNRVNQLDT